ncbi:MAG: FkbM family methyltransferase [bacterium]
MSKQFKKFIWGVLNHLNLGGITQLYINSALKNDGWFKSFRTKKSIDLDGNPIPWLTYSFIKFIQNRLNNSLTVFEYGSGNSTLWFASKIKSIISVENDKNWYESVKTKIPSNAKIIYRALEYHGSYAEEISKHYQKFNIIIIDGRDRNYCATLSPDYLTEDGVVFFDNADLSNYLEGVNFLISKGFKKIDFWGLSPVTAHNTCSTVFYRTNNCLNI